MIASLVAALCLTQLASPALTSSDQRMPLLVLDLTVEGGVDPALGHTATGLVSSELSAYASLNVISNADVRAMMALEGEKQQAGCENSSCLAELAGALGARLVIFGSVAMLGQKTVVQLNLFDSKSGQSVGRQFIEVKDPGELSAVIPWRLRDLIEPFAVEAGIAMPPPPSTPRPPKDAPPTAEPDKGPLPLALAGGGVAAIAVGAVVGVVGVLPLLAYQSDLTAFNTAKSGGDLAAATDARRLAESDGNSWNSWGVAVAVGGAAVGTAGVIAGLVGMTMMVSE